MIRVKVNQGRRKTPLKQGRPIWQREGIMVRAVDLWETLIDFQGSMTSTPPTWVNLRNISRHPY